MPNADRRAKPVTMTGPASRSARRVGWALALVAVVVLVIIGARPRPTSGESEDRLYAIASDLKCLQCAGETVAGSQVEIAIKMRSEIRAQMGAGRTDDEIFGYFADRYGERVLLNPSGSGVTGLVWVIPVVVGGAAVLGLGLAFGRWRRQRDDRVGHEISAEDRALVDEALRNG